jgi:hypothetical protein
VLAVRSEQREVVLEERKGSGLPTPNSPEIVTT